MTDGDGERFLYFREYKTNEGTNSSESRTIYVGNLHVGCDAEYLAEIFGTCDAIEKIECVAFPFINMLACIHTQQLGITGKGWDYVAF